MVYSASFSMYELLLKTFNNFSITVSLANVSNHTTGVVVEASDLRMTLVFVTGLLIHSNMDPRHFYFNYFLLTEHVQQTGHMHLVLVFLISHF